MTSNLDQYNSIYDSLYNNISGKTTTVAAPTASDYLGDYNTFKGQFTGDTKTVDTGPQKAYEDLYNSIYGTINRNVSTVDSPQVDPSAIKQMLVQQLRPQYDKQISQANKQSAANRAALDSDAAARGMGSSTWLSDVKNRNNNALLSNLSDIYGNYAQTLYSALLNQINQQQQNKMAADQFNASARNAANQNAMGEAGNQYSQQAQAKLSNDQFNASALNSALTNALNAASQTNQNKITTDQFNASAMNAAAGNAMSSANSMFDKLKKSSGTTTKKTDDEMPGLTKAGSGGTAKSNKTNMLK